MFETYFVYFYRKIVIYKVFFKLKPEEENVSFINILNNLFFLHELIKSIVNGMNWKRYL